MDNRFLFFKDDIINGVKDIVNQAQNNIANMILYIFIIE